MSSLAKMVCLIETFQWKVCLSQIYSPSIPAFPQVPSLHVSASDTMNNQLGFTTWVSKFITLSSKQQKRGISLKEVETGISTSVHPCSIHKSQRQKLSHACQHMDKQNTQCCSSQAWNNNLKRPPNGDTSLTQRVTCWMIPLV